MGGGLVWSILFLCFYSWGPLPIIPTYPLNCMKQVVWTNINKCGYAVGLFSLFLKKKNTDKYSTPFCLIFVLGALSNRNASSC